MPRAVIRLHEARARAGLEPLLQEIEAVVVNTKELAAQSRGVIRIASLPSISSTILPTAVARFKGLYPGISVVLKDVIAQRLVTVDCGPGLPYNSGRIVARNYDL